MPLWPKQNPRPGIDEYGRPSIWYLAANGDLAGVIAAVATGSDPNTTDDSGFTPLHVAVQNGHVDVIQYLISVSGNANSIDKHGNSPLWTAMLSSPRDKKCEIIPLLVAAGSDPDHKNIHGKSPRDIAVTMGNGLEEFLNRT